MDDTRDIGADEMPVVAELIEPLEGGLSRVELAKDMLTSAGSRCRLTLRSASVWMACIGIVPSLFTRILPSSVKQALAMTIFRALRRISRRVRKSTRAKMSERTMIAEHSVAITAVSGDGESTY